LVSRMSHVLQSMIISTSSAKNTTNRV
jgi:hypothetical protein